MQDILAGKYQGGENITLDLDLITIKNGGLNGITPNLGKSGVDTATDRYLTEYKTNTSNTTISVESVTIDKSKAGVDGKDGTSHSTTIKNLNGGNEVINSTNNQGKDGTSGTKGTDAHLYGNGGNGGKGGDGESFIISGMVGSEDGKTYNLNKDITISATGGKGANGANGGYADGPDHQAGRTQAGNGGNGGNGGNAQVNGFYVEGAKNITLNLNANINLSATAGKGGEAGKGMKGDKGEGGGSLTILNSDGYQTAIDGNDGIKGNDGLAEAYGIHIANGAILNLFAKDDISINVTANGTNAKASSLYADNATLKIGSNLSLKTTTNGQSGSGATLKNSRLDFIYDKEKGDEGFHKLTSDSITLEGNNNFVFNTDYEKNTGDKLSVDKFIVNQNTGKQSVSIRDEKINQQLENEGLTSGTWDTDIVLIESKENFDKNLKFESSGSGGGYDTTNGRYGVELEIQQTTNKVIVDKVSIVASKQGQNGQNGLGYNSSIQTNLFDLPQTLALNEKRNNTITLKGIDGEDGKDGTNAYLYGSGGDGGDGGNGEGFRAFGYKIENSKQRANADIKFDDDFIVSLEGGNGGKAGNGGLGDGADHKYNNGAVNKVSSGDAGNGGRGGDAVAMAVLNTSGQEVDIKLNANIDITTKAGKGQDAGKVGDITNATIINEDAKFKQSLAGNAGINGVDGLSYAVGFADIGGTLNINSDNEGVKNIKVSASTKADDKSNVKAYSIYANGSNVNFGTSLNLETSINENQLGNGAYFENSRINFSNMNFPPFEKPQNKASAYKFRNVTSDKFQLVGNNEFGFYTDLANNTGDSYTITKTLDISKLNYFKVEILDDASLGISGSSNPNNETITGKHTLIDLSKVDDNKKFQLDKFLQAANASKTYDRGAISFSTDAKIEQDKNTGNIVVEEVKVINNNQNSLVDPSEIVKAIVDNGFLMNNMHLLSQNQLSERFRIIKEDDNCAKSGTWIQAYNSHLDQFTTTYGRREISSIYSAFKYGIDGVTNFNDLDLMTGAYVGYGTLHSKLLNGGQSQIDNISLGFYAAWAYQNGIYFESQAIIDHYKNKINAFETGSANLNSADFNAMAYSLNFALGKKHYLPNGLFIDLYADLDYTYYDEKNFNTSNNLKITQNPYQNLGLIGSIMVGREFDNSKGMIYTKTDVGHYFSDADDTGKIVDPLTGNWDYKLADYSYTFANAILGVKYRPSKALELSLEANRYFMTYTNANYGIRGEFRYRF
ncbi:autotransporter outer membrane beta-barrel domain-containing protein [Campylobacter jejuni]|nr:autotransporter outer membrane beta-barrel domain-containing protein [Campylobacter jejuni]